MTIRRSTSTGSDGAKRRLQSLRRSSERLEERGLLSASVLDVSTPQLTRDAIVATSEPDRFAFTITPEMGGGNFDAQIRSTNGNLIPRLSLSSGGALLIQTDSGVLHQFLSPGTYELSVSSQLGLGDYELSTKFVPSLPPNSVLPVGRLPRAVVTADINGDGFDDVVTADFQGETVTTSLGNGDGTFQKPMTISANGAVALELADINGDQKLDILLPVRAKDSVFVKLGNGDGTFQTGTLFPAGRRPGGIASGDFNGDGFLDVAVSNYAGNNASISLGTGDGSLQHHLDLTTGRGPGRVCVADLDGDGFLDLLTPNYSDGTISVFRGDGAGNFSDSLTFAAGTSPYLAKVANIDGDGILDVVAVNYSSSRVAILKGKGNAQFAEPRFFDAGAGVYDVAIADLNGDGFADIATASFNDNSAGVLLGKGDASFAPLRSFAAGNGAGSIAVGDFDRDGKLDLVTADFADNTASILLGRGDGTFFERTATTPNLRQYSIQPGDLNGDGRPDLMISNKGTDSVSVLLRNADGTFQRRQSYPTVAKPNTATLGDINGDGFLDIIASSYVSPEVGVHFGRGDGTFESVSRFEIVASSYQVTAADVNGDGFVDVLTASNENSLEVVLADGQGRLTESQSFPSGTGNTSVAASDLNGDGHVDAVLANFREDSVSVLTGNGDGTFQSSLQIEVGLLPNIVLLVDVDGDGDVDVVTANTDDRIAVLINDGLGNFERRRQYAAGDVPNEIAMGDFNEDGFVDFFTASSRLPSGAIVTGRGDGTFNDPVTQVIDVDAGGIAVLDLNADGHQDLFVIDYKSDRTSTLFGRGDGTFSTAILEPVGKQRHTVVTVDVNDDGKLDALTTNLQRGTVSISLGTGSGSFEIVGELTVGLEPTGLVTGDFNFDGRVDLATVNSESHSVSVSFGNGDGTFNDAESLAVGQSPRAIKTADIDGDGISDLIVANYNDGSVSVLTGRRDGTFSTARTVNVGQRPYGLVVTDIDGDGALDVAVSNVASNSITLLYGDGSGAFGTPQTHAVGKQPIALTAGDFNADGLMDFATAGAVDRAIDVLFGQPARGFSSPQPIANSGSVYASLETADLDADGTLDLIASDLTSESVTLIFGEGDGTFLTSEPLPRSSQSAQTVIADINQDGRVDLVTVNNLNDEIGVLQNVGQRNFETASAATDVGQLTTPRLVDLNGDGVLDRVILDGAGRLQFRAGLSDAVTTDVTSSFAPPIVLNPGRAARDFTIARVGNEVTVAAVDTRFDPVLSAALLAQRSESDDEPAPFVNTSASDFVFAVSLYDIDLVDNVTRRTAFTTSAAASRILASDLNGDGRDELITANGLGRSLSIARQLIGGAFAPPVLVPVGNAPSGLAVSDVNRDGRLDVLASNQGSGDVSVALNDAAFAFDDVLRFRASTQSTATETVLDEVLINSIAESVSLATGDFTSDGLTDVVVVNRGAHAFSVLVGNGRGGFENPTSALTTSTSFGFDINDRPGPVVAGDFDRDGKLDVAVLMEDSGQLWIFAGNGDGTFENSFRIAVGDQTKGLSVVSGTTAGMLDLLVGNGFGDVLHLEGKGDGTFQIRGNRVSLSVVPDLLGPGQAGVLVGNQEDNRVTVQTRTSDEDDFNAVQELGGGLDSQLAPGDVQWTRLSRTSNLPDAVVVSTGGNAVIVYHTVAITNGVPVFDPNPQTFFVGTAPTSVTVQDINADSVPDMLVANPGSNDVSVLFGIYSADGVWSARSGPRLRSGGAGPLAVTVRDLNGDNVDDIAVTNGSSGTVTALNGVGQGFFDDRRPQVLFEFESTLDRPPTFAPGTSVGFAVLTSGEVVRFDLDNAGAGVRVAYDADSVVTARALATDRLVVATAGGNVRLLKSDGGRFVVESELQTQSNGLLAPSSLAILPTAAGGFQVLVTSQGSDSVTVFSTVTSVAPLVSLSTMTSIIATDLRPFSFNLAPLLGGGPLDVGIGLSLAAFTSQVDLAFSASSSAALVAVDGDSYSTVAVLDFGTQQGDESAEGQKRDPSHSRRHSFGDDSPLAKFVIGLEEAVENFRRQQASDELEDSAAESDSAAWDVDLFQPQIPRFEPTPTEEQPRDGKPMTQRERSPRDEILDDIWQDSAAATIGLSPVPSDLLDRQSTATSTTSLSMVALIASVIPVVAKSKRPRRQRRS